MSKGNTFEPDLLALIFNATAIANIADNAATSPLTNLYVSLHTADPGEAGSQTTSETAYTGYARVAVARTSGGWTVASGSVSPNANIASGRGTASPGAAITTPRSVRRPVAPARCSTRARCRRQSRWRSA